MAARACGPVTVTGILFVLRSGLPSKMLLVEMAALAAVVAGLMLSGCRAKDFGDRWMVRRIVEGLTGL